MNTRKPVVLVAPLDWGLGHTIRCIPIIGALLANHCEVLVACNSRQKHQFVQEFSSLQYIDLEGYDIHYGKSRLQTVLSMIFQTPKILNRVQHEQIWLANFIKENHVDAIVSDNRYGLSTTQVPCVLVTHQLRVRSGLGNLVDGIIQKRLYRYIDRFSTCWVPDWQKKDSAAGELSNPKNLPRVPVNYIGCLSRLNKCPKQSNPTGILIILSGPEPQRTILEDMMMEQLRNYKDSGVLVRGIINDGPVASFNKVTVLNYVSSSELNSLICNASIVICRAGYTSIMDLLKLGKKAVLIPTPGQAEQEYLANHLHRQKRAIVATQKGFRLKAVLDAALALQIETVPHQMDDYKKVVEDFCRLLRIGDRN